jgi:DNA repair exonuclease SbcCD ATPase subunit
MEELKLDIKVKRIYFLSDIHIKNDPSRNIEYYSVLKNLFKYYKKEKVNSDDLIVITGDIMDNGYAVSGNAIEMVKYLYVNLSKFCPVVSILGNHDLKTNVDTLTPIVKEYMNTKHQLYFLLENKIYIYGNIAFGHTRFDSKEVTCCKKYNKKHITIGLYHGMLNGSKLDNEYICRDNFSLKDFKHYKYCAYGDIHKMQFLREDKTAFYTGSLIAQKISEDAFIHGTMKLDIIKEEIEFIEIQNEHKKLNLILDDDGNVSNYDMNKIMKHTKVADIQFSYKSFNENKIEMIKQKFLDNGIKLTNILQKPILNSVVFDTSIKINDNEELKLSSIVDKKTCEKFLLSYVESKHQINNKDRFNKNLNKLLDNIKFDDILKQKRNIQFLNIDINNIMIYDKDIKIDINKFHGITGICETNSSGKSTLCEIISLILFGYTPRCDNIYSFIRNNQKEGNATLKIMSNGIEYEITRQFILHSSTDDKFAHETFMIKKYIDKQKGQYIHYVKQDARKTKIDGAVYKTKEEMRNIINNEIITYDELYQMIIMSQNREKSFLEEKDKDELLFKTTNLSYLKLISNTIDDLYSDTKNSIKDTLKKFCSKDFTENYKKTYNHIQSYEHSKKILEEYELTINNYDNDKIKTENNKHDKYISLNNELISLNERINFYKEYDVICHDHDKIDITTEIEETKNISDEHNKTLIETDKNIDIINKKIKKFNKKLNKYDDIENKNNIFNEEQKQKVLLLNKNILELHKTIKDISYKNISDDEYNELIINKDLIENENKTLTSQLAFCIDQNNKVNTINGIRSVILDYDEYNKLINDKVKIDFEIKFIDEYKLYIKKDRLTQKNILDKKTKLLEQIEELNKKIELKVNNKINYDSLTNNNDYEDQIMICQSKININIEKLNVILHKINDYNQMKENNNITRQIHILEEQINEEDNKEYEDYNKYCDILKELKDNEKELTILQYNKEKIINKINKEEQLIKDNENKLLIINKNITNYETYCKLKKNIIEIKKELVIAESEYNKQKQITYNEDIKIKELKNKCIIAREIINKCGESLEDIKDYELLLNILKNNGLCDKLLKEQIIVNLQKSIDDICLYIGHEKIYVNIENLSNNQKKKYNIIIRTDKIKDIANAGGFQKNIMELIFKVAFLRINTYLQSDFIIIDELFDACSEENKPMAIKLVEYFKTQYKKILLVSHNQSIINLFDKRLIIERDHAHGNKIIQK